MSDSFFVLTLGCKLNIYESESIISILLNNDYYIAATYTTAEIVIINTCTVTGKADSKSRNLIRKVRNNNKNAVIVVCGCLVNTDALDIKEKLDIDILLENKDKDKIIDALKAFYMNDSYIHFKSKNDGTFNHHIIKQSFHSRAFLKIQDGCSQLCSYCKIPFARGETRSRDYSEIIIEIHEQIKNCYEEVILTGINIGTYNYNGIKIGDLLEMLLNEFDDYNIRFRISSIEPQFIDDKFIQMIKNDKICSHLHIPLQSGSDKILKLMNRKYTKIEYKDIIEKVRNAKKDLFLSTDLILGFPDEQIEDFNEILNYVKEIDFSYIHLFGFSPRKGTKAFDLKPKIPERIRDERIKELNEIVKTSNLNYRKKFIGKKMDIIIERDFGDYIYNGKSSNYIDIKLRSNRKLERKKTYQILFTEIKNEENLGLFEE